MSNELAARSKFSEGLTKASKCYELRDRYIRDMNLERSNPFNKDKGQVCDGNHFMSHTLEGNPSATTVANVTGSDELNALANPQTATYRVTSGGGSVTATCP